MNLIPTHVLDLTPGSPFYTGDALTLYGIAPPPPTTVRQCQAVGGSEQWGLPEGLIIVWCHNEIGSTSMLAYAPDAIVSVLAPEPARPSALTLALRHLTTCQMRAARELGRLMKQVRDTPSLEGWEEIEARAELVRELHRQRCILRGAA